MPPSTNADPHDPIGAILDATMGAIVAGETLDSAQSRIAAEVGSVDDDADPATYGDEDWPTRRVKALVRQLWRRTPSPADNYALPTVAAGERNAPCPCGSERKFKHCCEAIERSLPELDPNFLHELLEFLPQQRWRELAGSRVGVDALAEVALMWEDEGRAGDIVSLLEPWFADAGGYKARHADLFTLLLDAYGDLRQLRLQRRLIDDAVTHGDRDLRFVALQNRAALAFDDGTADLAWKAFEEARQLFPDDPALADLELRLLFGEGRETDGRARARYWIRKVQRLDDPAFDELLILLHDCVDRGAVAFREFEEGTGRWAIADDDDSGNRDEPERRDPR